MRWMGKRRLEFVSKTVRDIGDENLLEDGQLELFLDTVAELVNQVQDYKYYRNTTSNHCGLGVRVAK